MNASVLSAGTTVATALEAHPVIGAGLVARRTACVGCYLTRFCTLSDVAHHYDLPVTAFVEELRLAAAANPVSKGDSNA